MADPKRDKLYDKADEQIKKHSIIDETKGNNRVKSRMESILNESRSSDKNDPKKLQNELPQGYSYGAPRQAKGDHAIRAMYVKEPSGKNTETDMTVGGADRGKKNFSASYRKQHTKHKNTLKGIDREVSQIQNTYDADPKKSNKAKVNRKLSTDGRIARKARGILRGMKYEEYYNDYMEAYVRSLGRSVSYKVTPNQKKKEEKKPKTSVERQSKLDRMPTRGTPNEQAIARKKQKGPSLFDFK